MMSDDVLWQLATSNQLLAVRARINHNDLSVFSLDVKTKSYTVTKELHLPFLKPLCHSTTLL